MYIFHGRQIAGSLDINKISDGSYLDVFHPDSDAAFSQEDLLEIISP
jgi:hypothetical protein